MATDMVRFMLTVTPDIEEGLNQLKQEEFHNESKAEMMRYVLTVGLATIKAQKSEQFVSEIS